MQGHTINPLGQKSTVSHPGGPKCIARCIPQMMNFCVTVNCTNKAKKGDRKSFFLITHLVEEDHKANKRWLDSWLAGCTEKSKASELQTIPVCSDHFVTGRPAKLYETIHQDWSEMAEVL